MNYLERYGKGMEALSSDERKAVREAMEAVMTCQRRDKLLKAIGRIPAARLRTIAKRRSDAATDARRRRLVGARVPVELAERYRDEAEKRGCSLYRLVSDTLKREAERW